VDTDWSRLLDEARAGSMAAARTRERWLRRQATETATLVGTLLDLAEHGTSVSVATTAGRRHDGRIVAIGPDLVALSDRDAVVAVRIDAIAIVRPQPGATAGAATGDRPAALDLLFTELLGRLAGDGFEVSIAFAGGDPVSGVLVAAGDDVATQRVAPGADGLVYASLASTTSVRFRSG
jgi:hypothetical protein